jgi:hypothetical protein
MKHAIKYNTLNKSKSSPKHAKVNMSNVVWFLIDMALVVNEWCGKLSAEIDISCPQRGLQSVELLEHRFFCCLTLIQQGWRYVADIMWQLFANRGNLGPPKSFTMMQCSFDQPLCKAPKRFS